MYNLSAFISMNAMVNNSVGVVSPIGELSTYAGSFSREVGQYAKSNYADVRLHSFNSATDGTKKPIPDNMIDSILSLGQFLFNISIDGTLTDDKDACQQAIAAEFIGVLEIMSLAPMETNGTYWLPSNIIFRVLGSGVEENICRVWFADQAFVSQYDINEILVIPPVVPMDDLHKDRATALAKLRAINVHDMITREGELTGNKPETKLHTVQYDWVDKNDPSVRHATPFMVAIYGASGINDDLIRQALIDNILGNSVYPREEWEKIFPDLFRPTEFYIAPLWDRYSLPNNVVSAGLYSPTIPLSDFKRYAEHYLPDMESDFLESNLVAVSTVLKGLMFISIGNDRNRGDIFRFDKLWPQYINLPTTNADFNRIPTQTQQFIIQLIKMLVVAEELTDYSELPLGMTRVNRDGVKYLAASFNKVMYLIAAKANPQLPPAPTVPPTP